MKIVLHYKRGYMISFSKDEKFGKGGEWDIYLCVKYNLYLYISMFVVIIGNIRIYITKKKTNIYIYIDFFLLNNFKKFL